MTPFAVLVPLALWLFLAAVPSPMPRAVQGDNSGPEVFDGLAKKGDAESFDALVKVTGILKRSDTLADAYNAFRFFRSNSALAPRAIEFLTERALRGPKDARGEAVHPLRFFGDPGKVACVSLLRESKDADVQRHAAFYALDKLLTSGAEENLRLVLDHADADDVDARARPFQAFDPDFARPWLLKKLQDKKTSVGWVLVLIAALHDDPGEDVTAALCAFLRHKSSVLQVAALEDLVRRGEVTQARAQLERMRVSAAPYVKVEVVRIQTRLSKGDPAWRQTLASLAGSSDLGERIAAAAGYAVLADDDALAALKTLLGDRSWKVRHAALDGAALVRRKELLQPVVQRLDEEQGAMRLAVGQTLARLTGLDFGMNVGGWKKWYEEQGATFELPSAEAIAALEAKRAAPAADATTASFYGLPVYSKNVCFVVDQSGSMDESAGKDQTRFDVAKKELGALFARLTLDCRANLVFFDDAITPWQKRLRAMDDKARNEALVFVGAREDGGGTNIHGALAAAFDDDSVDTVYLLSDGDPSSGAVTEPLELRAEIDLWNRVASVTVHCVSVGQESKLLAHLAHDSGGYYLAVGLETDGK
jgi:hypothetical protein